MDKDEESPAIAVMIVREFLHSEFAQRRDRMGRVRFASMGPSPFWAQCWAEVADPELSPGLQIQHLPRDGCDHLRFIGGIHPDGLYEFVKESIENEVGLFYELVAERNLLDLEDSWIDAQLNELVRLQEARGPIAWVRRLWTSGRWSLSVSLQVLVTQSRARTFESAFQDSLEAHYLSHPQVAIGPWIDREVSRQRRDRRAEVREMVSLLNAGHSNSVQVVAVIASSLGGGVVGAALAALAARVGS